MIISGGQTGVDRAALDFAMEEGMDCGGWCPRNRIAEDGIIPEKYPLTETDLDDYAYRTFLNVKESDGSLVLFSNTMDKGTFKTLEYISKERKKFLKVDLSAPIAPGYIRDWINENNISSLNIAGPRESSSPGIYAKSKSYLRSVFSY